MHSTSRCRRVTSKKRPLPGSVASTSWRTMTTRWPSMCGRSRKPETPLIYLRQAVMLSPASSSDTCGDAATIDASVYSLRSVTPSKLSLRVRDGARCFSIVAGTSGHRVCPGVDRRDGALAHPGHLPERLEPRQSLVLQSGPRSAVAAIVQRSRRSSPDARSASVQSQSSR